MLFNPLIYSISFDKPRRLTDVNSWHEHIPFAFSIIQMVKPKVIVELGTHKGDSYCAFCQAVDELGLDSKCYAIDTWEGDEHSGLYGHEVLEELRAYHDPLYGRFSRLIKSQFDTALDYFSEGSIDLLHIDGLHTYKAVKNDFENWLPKMSKSGIILLHDINVREREFGVWRLCEELKGIYSSFEFKYGHGLLVLVVGEKVPEELLAFLNSTEKEKATISKFFYHLGSEITLNRALQTKDIQINELKSTIRSKDAQVQSKDAQVQSRDTQINELNTTIQTKDAQINEFSSVIQNKDVQIAELNNAIQSRNTQIANLSVTLQSMHQSMVWQLLMKFHHVIEYIFPQNTRRGKYYYLGLMYSRIAMKDGLRRSWQKYKDDKKVHNTLYKNNIKIPKLDLKIANSIEEIETIQKDVSIVIPTKNAGLDFEFTLEKIRYQKGMKNIEIIIVDSGSNDDTIKLAQKYGSKVYIIKPEEFNHGATRNFGAEKATGDYVLFLVQDAIPIGEYWLYNMVKVLENDDKIAAASCRQVPRSDAELFTCSLLWNHSRMLGLNEDRLSSLSQNFNDLSIIEKRKIAGLEDVCCLLRKEIFDDLKFKNIKYAEDLELGIRILENKYKIAYLFSVGVIHSHNRTPIYFLKRSYVDNKILPGILSYEPYYFTQNYKDIYEVISDIIISYMVLNASIESLKSISFNNNATELISKFRSFIQVNSKKNYYELKKFDHGNISLDDFFDEQQKKVSIINTTSKDLLITNFFYLVEDFRLYSKLYPSMNYKKEEFIVDLYKLFSLAAGSMLANYYLFKSRGTEIDDKLSGIDSILSRGI